jgi:hypothetical protein
MPIKKKKKKKKKKKNGCVGSGEEPIFIRVK